MTLIKPKKLNIKVDEKNPNIAQSNCIIVYIYADNKTNAHHTGCSIINSKPHHFTL